MTIWIRPTLRRKTNTLQGQVGVSPRLSRLFVFIALFLSAAAHAAEGDDYLKRVKPILMRRCYACHGALKQQAELRLDTAAFVYRGGESGAAIQPKKPNDSLLFRRIVAKDPAERMPPEGQSLTAAEIKIIRAWIAAGAKPPAKEKPQDDPRLHWSFQVPLRSKLTVRPHSIDSFIVAQQVRAGLKQNPTASRRVRVRRAFLDLIGLPPTPRQVQQFLADKRPNAYQHLVDRLLASPLYGERWGRHWMDIWRYSDWYGRRAVNDVRNSYPEIWRWRDWIVRSLNEDKGYDRMVKEMLAADEIASTDDQAIVATGYLVRSWYSLNYDQWMKDLVEHTGKAFLGIRFNCAHCHDHKYDPISQEDYFRLRAVFEPMELRQDQVPGGPPLAKYIRYKAGGGASLKPIAAGLARIFDENPVAKTYMYQLGDARNRFKRPPVGPGVPGFLGGKGYQPKKVQLPLTSYNPGLKPFVAREKRAEIATRRAAARLNLAKAELAKKALPKPVVKIKSVNNPKLLADPRQDIGFWRFEGKGSQFLRDETGNASHLTRVVGRDPPVAPFALGESTLAFRVPRYFKENRQAARFDQRKHFSFLATGKAKVLNADALTFQSIARFDDCETNFNRTIVAVPNSWMLLHRGIDASRFELRLIIQDVKGQKQDIRSSFGAPLILEAGRAYYLAVTIGDSKVTFYACDLQSKSLRSKSVKKTVGKLARANEPVFVHIGNSDETGRLVGLLDEVRLSRGVWSESAITQASGAENADSRLNNRRQRTLEDLRLARLDLLAADTEHDSFEARWKASRAETVAKGAPQAKLKKQAAELERKAAIAKAERDVLLGQLSLRRIQKRTSKALTSGRAKVAAARTALKQAMARTKASFTPLGPLYPRVSSGRRRALANWIASSKNPLTARVAVNHIWMRHFGRPLVESTFDFGRSGKKPTHPMLLDYLALELVESNWSMKHIHRLIMTSQVYQSSSDWTAAKRAKDKINRTVWRFPSRRLEAEAIRDSLLHVAQSLNLQQGGKDIANQYSQTSNRRSMYFSIYPEEGGSSQFGTLFDAPDPCDCYRRFETIVPQQSLAMTNSGLARNLARKTAARLTELAGGTGDRSKIVEIAFQTLLSRKPSRREDKLCQEFLQRQVVLYSKTGANQLSLPVNKGDTQPSTDVNQRAYEGLVRALFNHTDFITIR